MRKSGFSKARDKLLSLLKANTVVTTAEIALVLKMSWNTAEKYLLELALEGHVQRIKKLGANIWVFKQNIK